MKELSSTIGSLVAIVAFMSMIELRVAWPEINVKLSDGQSPISVDSSTAERVLQALSPFHNLAPDAYLDPVSSCTRCVERRIKS